MARSKGSKRDVSAPSPRPKRTKGRSGPTSDELDEAGLETSDEGAEEADEDEELDPEVLVGEVISDEESALVQASFEDDDEDRVEPRALRKAADRTALIKHDPLSAYIQETRRYPLLSREEEHELAVKLVETGDADAARRLVESNLRLVVKIAYEYRRAHRNLLDLVQEGNVGLMQAVAKYDPYRGVKLSSYAAWWIRAYMLKFILNNWRLVKIGTTQAQRKLFFNLKKEREKLEQLGFEPDTKLLAERLDVREKDVVEMEKRLAAPDASFDAPVGNGSGDGDINRTRHDIMSDSDAARPDRAVEESEFQDLLKSKLAIFAATLEGREETIFRERWLTDEPKTLQEIGEQYGVSRERARQIEKRMLGRLRSFLEAELGSAVDIDAMSRD